MTKHLKDADPKAIRWIIGDDMSQFELLELLDEMIAEEPVDLVVIDGPMDLYQGRDGNSNLEMRAMMRAYNSIPQAHDCPILLIHHINKGSYHTAPQQGSVQGAGSMAQKARFVVQLDPESGSNTKYLSITKGNFLSNQEKAETIILDFDPDSFMFNATGETKSVHAIGSGKSKDESYNNPQTMENLAKTVFGEDDLLTYTELHKRIMAQMDYSDTHANRCVRSMKAFCIVEQPQPRGPYKLTSIHPSPKDMDE